MSIPLYFKQSEREPEPADPVYYLLTGDGLFLNRNTPFFSSSVPAPGGPPVLCRHAARLENRFPAIPGALFERVAAAVGDGPRVVAAVAGPRLGGSAGSTVLPRPV